MSRWHPTSFFRHGIAVIAGLVFTLVCSLQFLGMLQRFEFAIYDNWVQSASVGAREESPKVVIIELREQDLQELGHWPVSDRVLAKALGQLTSSDALAIGIDWYRDLPVPPGEADLERALRTDPRIIGVRKFGSPLTGGVAGSPILEQEGRVGFNDLPVDPVGETSRRGLLFQDDGVNPVESSFSFRLTLLALAAAGGSPTPDPLRPEWMRIGPSTIAPLNPNFGAYVDMDAAGYQYMLDYARQDFPVFTFSQLLRGEIESESVRDAVILIGSNAESLPDVWATPIGSRPGVHVHAHQVDQLLRYSREQAKPLRALPIPVSIFLTLLFTLIGCFSGSGAGPGRRSSLATAAFGLVALLILFFSASTAFRASWWIPIVPPMMAAVMAGGITAFWSSVRERRERSQLMGLFSRHVAPAVANELWSMRDQFTDGGRPVAQRLDATVLFVDMVGSTQHSEQLDPARLMEWSNRFMGAMASEVATARGVVDDYFGDGLKATFGVPIARTVEEEIAADAQSAIDCALAMGRALRSVNQENDRDGLPSISIRIGIDTGTVVAGCLGSSDRLKYTVMGDVVVTAARLEQTREIGHDFDADPSRIIVSERTMRRSARIHPAEPLGQLSVRGRREPVEVFRVPSQPPR